MEYQIISSWFPAEVEEAVKRLLVQGWQCQGGVAVGVDANGDKYYAQAMVKLLTP